jgi:hypothetical protein
MAKRLYVVAEAIDGPHGEGPATNEYLVEAGTPAQAIGHKVKNRYSAEAAKSSDVARLMSAGVVVEKAGE